MRNHSIVLAALVATLLGAHPAEAKPATPEALFAKRTKLRKQLRKKSLKQLERLAKVRQALEAARAEALARINDSTRYYKDKTDKVHGGRDVALAVAKVKRLARLRLPRLAKSLRKKALQLIDIDNRLSALGRTVERDRFDAWLLDMSRGAQILADLPLDLKERARLKRDREVRANNRRLLKETGHRGGEATVVRRTNTYRRLFGRPALLADAKLRQAAVGHSVAMVRRNFFAHMSPVPGLETPGDRVQKTGFQAKAVTENIAKNYSATTVLGGWCRSPGHHRNVLNDFTTRIGVGNSAGLWTQLFGAPLSR